MNHMKIFFGDDIASHLLLKQLLPLLTPQVDLKEGRDLDQTACLQPAPEIIVWSDIWKMSIIPRTEFYRS